ncbi:HNH endonuclease [Streptomyces sp. NPDC001606]
MGRKRKKFDTWFQLMILMANEGRCVYCDAAKSEVMDHVIPFAHGGADNWKNLVPACKRCNQEKADRSVLTWIADRVSRGGWYEQISMGSTPHGEQGLEWLNGQIDYVYQNIHALLVGAYEEIGDAQRRDWFFDGFWSTGRGSFALSWGRARAERDIPEAKQAGYPKRPEQPKKRYRIVRDVIGKVLEEIPGDDNQGIS